MTVLAKYQRLEAEGIWRADPEAQRQDVIVAIGEATLTISAANGTALAHWSLPAIERLNPGELLDRLEAAYPDKGLSFFTPNVEHPNTSAAPDASGSTNPKAPPDPSSTQWATCSSSLAFCCRCSS